VNNVGERRQVLAGAAYVSVVLALSAITHAGLHQCASWRLQSASLSVIRKRSPEWPLLRWVQCTDDWLVLADSCLLMSIDADSGFTTAPDPPETLRSLESRRSRLKKQTLNPPHASPDRAVPPQGERIQPAAL